MSNQTKYIIRFEFLGTNFHGSQIQPNKRTVQGELEKAFRTLIKSKVNIIFSGRTDAKVSAKYQTAHFAVENTIENIDKFLYSINSILPNDIKIFDLEEVDFNFHAQKSAKYKHYRYAIQSNRVASVFFDCSLFYPYKKLDIGRLNQSLSYLTGHHDFSAFKSKSDNPYNDCRIYYARAKKEKIERVDFIFIDIIGNRFLYNMVRTIAGQLLYIERNNLNPVLMKRVLESKDRTKAANVADAHALMLMYVGYDDVNNYIQKLNSQKEGK